MYQRVLYQLQGNSIISNLINKRNIDYSISELLKPFGNKMMLLKHKLCKYDKKLLCIRSNKYKYIYSTDKNNEFYNIEEDPNENINKINVTIKVLVN